MKKYFKLPTIFLVVMLVVLSSIFCTFAAELLDSNRKVSITLNCTKPGYTFTVYEVATLDSKNSTPYETKYTSLIPAISASVLAGDSAAALKALDRMETIPETAPAVGSWSTETNTTKTFANLAQGIYYIKAVNYPAGVKAVTNSIVALPYYDNDWIYSVPAIDLATKVVDEVPETNKTITNSTKNNENYTDVSLGDTVNFEIRSTTAGSSSMKLSSYYVTDDMSAGLTLNKSSFNVALLNREGNKITNLDKSEYTVDITSEKAGSNTTFNIALTNAYLQTSEFYASDVYYTSVTYSAVLNKYSVVGVAGNPNTEGKLVYSNKNGVESSVTGNTVYVYTYGIKNNKYDETGRSPIANAEFALFKTTDEAANLKNEIATGISDENGLVKYYNTAGEEMRLQSGTYYVRETNAPAGYMLYGGIIEVSVNATYGNTLVNGTYVTNCPENGYATFDITNHKIVFMQTGGTGKTIFFVVSVLTLTSGLAFIFFYRKRKRKE